MADTDVTTPTLPTAGDIWVELSREERERHLGEAEADQKRRAELFEEKIHEIVPKGAAPLPGQERK